MSDSIDNMFTRPNADAPSDLSDGQPGDEIDFHEEFVPTITITTVDGESLNIEEAAEDPAPGRKKRTGRFAFPEQSEYPDPRVEVVPVDGQMMARYQQQQRGENLTDVAQNEPASNVEHLEFADDERDDDEEHSPQSFPNIDVVKGIESVEVDSTRIDEAPRNHWGSYMLMDGVETMPPQSRPLSPVHNQVHVSGHSRHRRSHSIHDGEPMVRSPAVEALFDCLKIDSRSNAGSSASAVPDHENVQGFRFGGSSDATQNNKRKSMQPLIELSRVSRKKNRVLQKLINRSSSQDHSMVPIAADDGASGSRPDIQFSVLSDVGSDTPPASPAEEIDSQANGDGFQHTVSSAQEQTQAAEEAALSARLAAIGTPPIFGVKPSQEGLAGVQLSMDLRNNVAPRAWRDLTLWPRFLCRNHRQTPHLYAVHHARHCLPHRLRVTPARRISSQNLSSSRSRSQDSLALAAGQAPSPPLSTGIVPSHLQVTIAKTLRTPLLPQLHMSLARKPAAPALEEIQSFTAPKPKPILNPTPYMRSSNMSFPSFLDGSSSGNMPSPGLPRQAPSPAPGSLQSNGIGPGSIPIVNGLPSAGNATDMAHLWDVVTDLATQLEHNRAETAHLVSSISQLQARAAAEGASPTLAQANGAISSSQSAAEIVNLQTQLSSAQSHISDLESSNAALQNLVQDYESSLARTLDMLRPYAFQHSEAIVALHAHYNALLDAERKANADLRIDHAEWQAGLAKAAEWARLALREYNDGTLSYVRKVKALKEENRVLRKQAGWPEGSDSEDEGASPAS
ncbi:hypothetical protein H2199_006783 [Coniosporium tulheliwenetii]|uniref:Uncharacterized protein n=1 Tax=Coniosporium tulheliwenetii TaxID=3383036 RepID=A0ACC2YU56_9PEZI|nr:hypothetical protein H2199_006783 [Cladosporium sp. JES 115]